MPELFIPWHKCLFLLSLEILFADGVFGHEFVQLTGSDAGVFCRYVDFALISRQKILYILPFKIFYGFTARIGKRNRGINGNDCR